MDELSIKNAGRIRENGIFGKSQAKKPKKLEEKNTGVYNKKRGFIYLRFTYATFFQT